MPNTPATPAPTVAPDPLAVAHARIARASFVVLADAADAEARGENVGAVWREVIHHNRTLLPFAREIRGQVPQ